MKSRFQLKVDHLAGPRSQVYATSVSIGKLRVYSLTNIRAES